MRLTAPLAALLTLSACAAPPPTVPPAPTEPGATRVFEVPLLGAVSKLWFATLALHALHAQDGGPTRVTLQANEPLESATRALALPSCYLLADSAGSTRWTASQLAPGEHVWTVAWRKVHDKCLGGGTLLYAVTGSRHGDRGSVPFSWPP